MESFDCYKVYLLGKPNSLSCHSQNLKQNKTYAKFLLNKSLQKNFGMSDVLISPVQRMARYDLMIRSKFNYCSNMRNSAINRFITT
jgi:hypothetical protein